jgi:hypothetical protein
MTPHRRALVRWRAASQMFDLPPKKWTGLSSF